MQDFVRVQELILLGRPAAVPSPQQTNAGADGTTCCPCQAPLVVALAGQLDWRSSRSRVSDSSDQTRKAGGGRSHLSTLKLPR